MKQQSIKFKGVNISFANEGEGKVIVFLHGFLESKEIWKPFSGELSKTYQVITIDLLGHGNSECLSYIHTMAEMAAAVSALLTHLKIDNYMLIGHSMGGYVSLALAEKYPKNVNGLCLFHSTAKADNEKKKTDRDRAIQVVKRNRSLFINEAIPQLFSSNYQNSEAIDKIKKIALKIPLQGVVAALEGMKIRDSKEAFLKTTSLPILYIIGKEDKVLPFQELIQQAELAENGSYMLLQNVAHMGFMEAKKETLNILKEFIQKN